MIRGLRSTPASRTLVVAVVATALLAGVAPALAAGATAGSAAATDDATTTEPTVEVTTLAPDPGEHVAYLGGNLTTLAGADGANLTIEYRRSGADAWQQSDAVEPRQSPDSFYLKVEGLEAGTTYEYRARADTWDGAATDVGAVRNVTTLDYPAVETGQPLGATERSFSVETNLTDVGGGDAATLRLEYRAADGSSWFEVADERTVERTGTYWLEADGLEADTAYEYRVVAVGADGLADYGERRTVRTDVPAEVRTGDAYVAGTNATLYGEVVSTGNVSETGAHIAYRQRGAANWTRTGWTSAAEPLTYSAHVSDLAPGTTYEYRAVLRTTDGDDDRGEIRTFTTDPALEVTTERPIDVGADAATLRGTLSALAGYDAAEVGFQYRTDGATEWTNTSLTTKRTVDAFGTTVDGLAPGRSYEVRAVAVAPDGTRDEGEVRRFRTDSAPVVTTGAANDVEPTSATLSGSLDDLGGADAVDLGVEYRPSGADAWQAADAGGARSPTSFAATVEGLAEETTYEFRAVGVADDGVVASGATRTFETPASAVAPTVERLRATEDSPPNPHAELAVDWSVADEDADLAAVTVEVRDASGRLVERRHRSVAGSAASGSEAVEVKHGAGETYAVTVSVEDAEGNVVAEETSVRA